MKHFGSAVAAASAPSQEIEQLHGFGPKIAACWGRWRSAEEMEAAEKAHVSIIPFTSPEYPVNLKKTTHFPIILYVKGTLPKASEIPVAVVGTRNATLYGKEMAASFGEQLARAGLPTISGLARGIDTAAHRGSLHSGKTVAVMGSGHAYIYPKENQRLAERIAEEGALISEYPMHTHPHRYHFPQRNRIVSGLSEAVVLVEAPLKSGAMITMKLAIEQHRKTFALPGRVDQPNFRGNLHLLKTGQATLVENAEDILTHFHITPAQTSAEKNSQPLNSEEQAFLKCLPEEEVSIEEMGLMTKVPIAKLNILLMSLVLKSAITEYPGKVYRKGKGSKQYE